MAMGKAGNPRQGPLKRLWSDENGSAAVEAAFVLPILIMMMLGTLELGMALFSQSVLDGATRDVARQIKTGQMVGKTATDFKAALCSRTGDSAGVGIVASALLDCEKYFFDVEAYTTVAALNTAITSPTLAAPSALTFTSGTGGGSPSYMAVRVLFPRPSILPVSITHLVASENLESTVIFRNEPF
jgi:Flp pilus assembly protein TadG